MKLRGTLFAIMGGIFIAFIVAVGVLSHLQSKSANEAWGKKLIQADLELKKHQTLFPLIHEIALLKQLSYEPDLIAMASDEFDPVKKEKGLKILEHYRLQFQNKRYAATFIKTHNQYRKNNRPLNGGISRVYALDPHKKEDQWFDATIASGNPFVINVEMKKSKIWINYVIKDQGRSVGVVGTSLDLPALLHPQSPSTHTAIKSYFIKKDLSIQLSSDRGMIDDNGMIKKGGEHKTIQQVINDPHDLEQIKEAMETLEYSPQTIKTFWMMVNGEKNLVGMAYSPEIGLYEMTFFDNHDLVLLDNHNLFLILSLLFLIAIIVVGLLISHRILSPIQQLKEHIVAFHENNEKGQLDVTMSGEIGELTHSIQVLLDQAYQQHATLSLSKNHLESILDHTDEAIAIIDSQQRLIVINTVWEAHLGYSAHALRSKSLETIIPAHAWPAHVRLLETLDRPLHVPHHPYRTKGGKNITMDVDLIPMESGEILMIAQGLATNVPRERTQRDHPTLVVHSKEGENTMTIHLTLEVEGNQLHLS